MSIQYSCIYLAIKLAMMLISHPNITLHLTLYLLLFRSLLVDQSASEGREFILGHNRAKIVFMMRH